MPAAQSGRSDLLAAIRGTSVHSLRKVTPGESHPVAMAVPEPASAHGGHSSGSAPGGDLTAALAAALLQRNKKLGESDDEDDDEDEDDEWD